MNKDKNIIRLYLLVALSLILNVVFIFGGHDLMEKNRHLRQEVSVLCGDLLDLRDLVETNHNNARGWRSIEDSYRKMTDGQLATHEVYISELSKRVQALEADRTESTSDKDMVDLKREIKHIKKSLFELADKTITNSNAVHNLEENLQIVDTFQWSAIRKLKRACPWVGLFD